ncbi:sensor histidine kinase [Prauserella muralis]|uniref:histidine kinase n=1 Tax=Prauserella muralis TaxID=588067 RepID=A0A2V4AYD8_9PSEU|nr:sensor histidine kinase [Prauserella muralis]PXY26926.1 two-component sensor histidine kinase [Prauserella muralis]TWE23462.1 signal transduction histidine kinase [Prauserella muralis]
MATDRGRRAALLDAALAAGVTGLALADAVLGSSEAGVLGYVLLLAGTLALAARSRAPRVVLAVTLLAGLAYTARVEPGPIATVPVLVAVYTVVSLGHRALGLGVAAPLLVFAVASNLAATEDATPAGQAIQEAILPVGWFVAGYVLGEVARHRRAYVRQAEERAAEAERTREEVALRRASEERLRIARELHDSLTHQISIIKVQAGVAVHLARKRGEDVSEALLAVQEASREATRELRATLEVLRDSDGEGPGHGLARLDDLVERAGVPATVTVDGPERTLPADVDRAAYRIVQEALTNVVRHAGAATASVRLAYGADALTIVVEDDGSAAPGNEPVPGVGLIGMRERVSALGGRLRAGPRAEGGFRVEASLPVGRPA